MSQLLIGDGNVPSWSHSHYELESVKICISTKKKDRKCMNKNLSQEHTLTKNQISHDEKK